MEGLNGTLEIAQVNRRDGAIHLNSDELASLGRGLGPLNRRCHRLAALAPTRGMSRQRNHFHPCGVYKRKGILCDSRLASRSPSEKCSTGS
jgi:hypothetical protein